MKIHEYQAKAILARHGVPVPRGEVAFNAAEAHEIAQRLGGGLVVVKAQIHAGGRGKGGGVKVAKIPAGGRDARPRHDRHDARHASDRAERPRGVARAGRRRPADDARALLERRPRSRRGEAGDDGERRGRDGHRRGRRQDARADRHHSHRAGRRPRAVRSAATRLRHRPRRRAGEQVREAGHRALRGVCRDRRHAARDQPARRHRRTASCSPSTRR